MDKKVIVLQDIHKVYNDAVVPVHALRGISSSILKGEFTAIVGPSGSGKSTLLNIVGGLDQPTSGKVIIDDKDLSVLTDNELIDFRKNHIGFVFQAYNLVPVLTAKENIELVMSLQGIDKARRKERSEYLLDAVGLHDRGDNRPAQLSGGQQQRVAVARALASKPAFVLADEPTANLDSKSTNNLLDIMERLNDSEGVTFLFSTHDQRVIDRARRVILIDDGIIQSDL